MSKLALIAVACAGCEMASAVTPAGGEIGTAAPVAGIMAPASGLWLVLCQARQDTDGDGSLSVRYETHGTDGDRVESYLVLGSGAGEAIDYPAAHTPDGAWLAVVRDHKLELIDGTTFQRTTLAADLRNDGEWPLHKNTRSIDFADDNSRAVYIEPDNTIVIRELATGHERSVAMHELVWRATIDATGMWAEVKTIPADSDRDGVIAWPGGPSTTSATSCSADAYHPYEPQAKDAVKTRWLELASGRLIDDPTVIGTVGGQLLHRAADGALVLGTQVIADAACHATVTGTIDRIAAPRAIITCNSTPARSDVQTPLIVAGPGIRVVTRAQTYPSPWNIVSPHDRFERIDDTTYIDLADGSEIKLPGKHVAGYLSQFILIEQGNGFAAFDLAKRVASPLLGAHGDRDDDLLGDQVSLGGELYDLRTAKHVGRAADDIAMIAIDGRVLHYAKRSKPGYAPLGPLRWTPAIQ